MSASSTNDGSHEPPTKDNQIHPDAQAAISWLGIGSFTNGFFTPTPGEALCRRTNFFINGSWRDKGTSMDNRMYVESLVPVFMTQPFPIILIHGDFHTSQIWQTKPDGHPGWASYFLRQGYHVYLVDLPLSGRSNFLTKQDSKHRDNGVAPQSLSAQRVQAELTAPGKIYALCGRVKPPYTQAIRHDKWPGTGLRGDEFFDNYFASLTSVALTKYERQAAAQGALQTLIETVGKSILVGQGTGCTMAWLVTDAVPDLVAGVIAVEPTGPPYGTAAKSENGFRDYDSFIRRDDNTRVYGLSDIPLTYDPPVRQPTNQNNGYPQTLLDIYCAVSLKQGGACMLQKPPTDDIIALGADRRPLPSVRQLVNLKKVPHAIITAEASSHIVYDWATAAFMEQAGVKVEHIKLEDHNILGNGHLMFLEKNSDEIAGVIDQWVRANVQPEMEQEVPTFHSVRQPPPSLQDDVADDKTLDPFDSVIGDLPSIE